MRHYEAVAEIAASPSRVWDILVDGAAWTTWDCGVEAAPGGWPDRPWA